MQHLNDVKGKEIVPGIFGRFVHGETMTLSFVDIQPGARLPEHSHPHEQITYLLEGELEMVIGGEKMLLTPGMVHVIPGNVPHSAIARTFVKVLDAFSPVREDYKV
ncbi:cupin [Niastella koreensis]|uniref:Cupin 2 conserved barrel domain protein n=2 Tax=Niastella koreensis TaxID=354356 RepID=G8TQQ0_NIAKG|nr:cupin domain-containing protein [Niastella koreensis]AEV96784.1 Cupin 2 conserved barrel domain protein [Niastella koreensis GR20-10]OQP49139.1 cupin [Niastella koreensis]